MTPSGFTPQQTRKFVYNFAKNTKNVETFYGVYGGVLKFKSLEKGYQLGVWSNFCNCMNFFFKTCRMFYFL